MPTVTPEFLQQLSEQKDTLTKLASAQLLPLFGEQHYGSKARPVAATAKEASKLGTWK
jgi:hypothetical protein